MSLLARPEACLRRANSPFFRGSSLLPQASHPNCQCLLSPVVVPFTRRNCFAPKRLHHLHALFNAGQIGKPNFLSITPSLDLQKRFHKNVTLHSLPNTLERFTSNFYPMQKPAGYFTDCNCHGAATTSSMETTTTRWTRRPSLPSQLGSA